MYPSRLKYDTFELALQKNIDIRKQNYTLENYQVAHPRPCLTGKMQTPARPTWPVAAGAGVSAVPGTNIVDLESELKGLTFDATKNPDAKYKPTSASGVTRSIRAGTQQVQVNFYTQDKPLCNFHNIPENGYLSANILSKYTQKI
jgi:hypothetical protein